MRRITGIVAGMRKPLFFSLAAVISFSIYYVLPNIHQIELNREMMRLAAARIDSLALIEPTMLYGFEIDSFDIIAGNIEQNQNLSEILVNHNVSLTTINELAIISKSVFDVRKFAVNRNYTIVCERDSVRSARQFIYEPNRLEYIVYNLVDSLSITRHEKEISIQQRVISGVIDNSLYETLEATGFGPLLTNVMVDIFAWQVDFFRIQEGDRFKVILDEQVIDGEMVGIERVVAAYFEHYGVPYYAIYFDQSTGNDYFDENGNSLRKAFLKSPLNYYRISSRFSLKRFHPVLKTYKAHLGTDYVADIGTPIRTVGDGVITEATYKKNNGNYVKVRHNGAHSTQYLHMSKIASGIRPGVKVNQGQTIGYVGSSGLASGPHLCFRFWKNGRQVNPMSIELPPSEPIKESYQLDYYALRDEMVVKLENIIFDNVETTALARIN